MSQSKTVLETPLTDFCLDVIDHSGPRPAAKVSGKVDEISDKLRGPINQLCHEGRSTLLLPKQCVLSRKELENGY